MTSVIFDIETTGVPWEAFDEAQQKQILKYAEDDGEVERAKAGLTFSPLTGEVVAIGMLNPHTTHGAVYFRAPDSSPKPFEENGIRFETGDEKWVLEKFWTDARQYSQIVTFNGRTFDGPFLHIRSAILGVKATRNLVPYRWGNEHIDLLEQLTFFGASRRSHFTLDMVCKAFGIKSPKSGGISGDDVPRLFQEKKYEHIARYCAEDLKATKELFMKWQEHMRDLPMSGK